MITIDIPNEYRELIGKYAQHFTIGGYSNLSKADLNKASRNSFQWTGLYGELGWRLHRNLPIEKFKEMLDMKVEICVKNNIGDNGYDDHITANGRTRIVDVKTSHIDNEERARYLNLIIPEREYHDNMIYVCAFTIGKTRENADKVVLVGWAISEDVHKRWKIDPKKFCVPVPDLRQMQELELYIR